MSSEGGAKFGAVLFLSLSVDPKGGSILVDTVNTPKRYKSQ